MDVLTCAGCEPVAARHVFSRNGVLVMEDLSASGFKMLDRMTGLDLHHSLLVMRTLAKFHASSVIAYEEEPGLYHAFMCSMYLEPPVQKLQSTFFVG